MLEEKTIDEVKHVKILSLNAACDPMPDDIKGTDILIVRFDVESEDQLVFVGYMTGMAHSAEVRFSVGIIITADEPDPLFTKCYDTVFCVSSEVEAESLAGRIVSSINYNAINFKEAIEIIEGFKHRGRCHQLVLSAYQDTEDITERRNLLKKAEEKAVSCWDYLNLGNDIICLLNDRKWAKSVYRKGEESTSEFYALSNIARSVFENAKDKKWKKEIYDRIEPTAESFLDFYTLAIFYSYRLKDKEKGRALCLKALDKAEKSYDFCLSGQLAVRGLKDKEWALELDLKAEDKAVTSTDLCCLASSVFRFYKSRKWGITLCVKAEGKAGSCADLYRLGDVVLEQLKDREWAEVLCKKAEDKAVTRRDHEAVES
ncbi:MAG TPA: hypothetical protein PLM72_12935, partial [Spirochaetota bacterium]|nr:hypothetical protein [Spirochaetota bacterium]